MAPSTRDGLLIALLLASLVLNNTQLFHRGAEDMWSWLSGVATGVLLACVVQLGWQIIKRSRGDQPGG